LLRQWRKQQELDEACEAIREGAADIEARRRQSLETFD
jgi:hypothetical protein